jgi:hypothetical protein
LQGNIAGFSAPIIALTCGKDYLTIENDDLEVPEGKTLTITHVAGTGANLSQTAIALTGEGTIDNTKAGALLALNGGLSLANITAAWPRQGFVQTAAGGITVITAYGTDNTWSEHLDAAFNGTNPKIDTLVVPQNAKLDFSAYQGGLTIPLGSALRLSGELACGANYKLTVTGTLYWGITGSITGAGINSAGDGQINYEMNPNWPVSFSNATEVQTYGTFMVYDGTHNKYLIENTDYTFTTNSPATGKATLAGKPATDGAKTGYYGSFTKPYQAVTGVTL